MKRTQIYLDEDSISYLNKESQTTHKSISEIIRASIKDKYKCKTNILLKRLNSIYGIWANKRFDVEQYVRDIRKDRTL